MNYCKECAIQLLEPWRGWPLRDPVPLLPHVIDGKCESCGSQSEVISNTEIQWLNYHGSYNTGLPDYWLLVTDQKTGWGLPYHSENVCQRCGSRAVQSEHGDSRSGRFEYKSGCTTCYAEKCKRKLEAKQRQQELEAMHRQKRQDYLLSISEIPFADRLSKIAGDKSINWQEWNTWKAAWCRCSSKEIAELSVEATQGLIDLCEGME